jgi:hypothetical protein
MRVLSLMMLLVVTATALGAESGATLKPGQPGYYGRIEIGDVPHPDLISFKPLVIRPASGATRPVYMHVPAAQVKDWAKHCGKYQACDQSVFFVKTQWYNTVYVPYHRERQARIDAAERAMLSRGQGQSDSAKGKGSEKSK